jgi:hypothetical protein
MLFVVGTVLGGMALIRAIRNSHSDGYRRRFNETPTRDDGAFPFASILYLGDGGSSGHAHHSHSVDCSSHADAGGGCADGGGGGGD